MFDLRWTAFRAPSPPLLAPGAEPARAEAAGVRGALSALLALAALGVALAFALPTLLAAPEPVDNDAAQYLSLALDAYQGRGFTFDGTHVEPILAGWRWYPLLFTAAWKLAGVSVEAAAWAARVALLACGTATFALGWRLYGLVAATVGTALLLALPLTSRLVLSLDVDVLQTALLLAFLAAFHRAASRPSAGWFVAAGLCLGLAERVRESALVWLPLPLVLLALVPAWRTRRHFLGAALSLGVVLGLVAPKLVYDGLLAEPSWMDAMGSAAQLRLLGALVTLPVAARVAAAIAPLIPERGRGAAAVTLVATAGVAALLLAATVVFVGTLGLGRDVDLSAVGSQLARYWDDRLIDTVSLWPALLPAWLVVLARAIRGARSDRVLALAALLLLPQLIPPALLNWNPRYFLPLCALSTLAVSSSLAWALQAVAARLPLRMASRRGAPALALAAGLAGAALMLATAEPAPYDEELRVYDELGLRAAQWLHAHVPPGTPIIAHYRLSSWLHFSSGGDYPVWLLPTERPLTAEDLVRLAQSGRSWIHIAIFQRRNVTSTYIGLGDDLLRYSLAVQQQPYLVLTGGYGLTSLAFDTALEPPAYREVFTASDKTRRGPQRLAIYQVSVPDLRPSEAPVAMTPDTLRRLAEDLGTEPDSGLWLLTERGVRLDLGSKGSRELAPGGTPDASDTVVGWLAEQGLL